MCEFCRVVPVAAKGLWFAESDSREGAFDDLNEETKENYFRSATYMILALKENFLLLTSRRQDHGNPLAYCVERSKNNVSSFSHRLKGIY